MLREIDDGSGSSGDSGSDDSDSDDCGQGSFGRGARGWGSGLAGAGTLLSEHWSAAAFQAPYLLPAEVAAGAHHRLLGSSEGAEEGGEEAASGAWAGGGAPPVVCLLRPARKVAVERKAVTAAAAAAVLRPWRSSPAPPRPCGGVPGGAGGAGLGAPGVLWVCLLAATGGEAPPAKAREELALEMTRDGGGGDHGRGGRRRRRRAGGSAWSEVGRAEWPLLAAAGSGGGEAVAGGGAEGEDEAVCAWFAVPLSWSPRRPVVPLLRLRRAGPSRRGEAGGKGGEAGGGSKEGGEARRPHASPELSDCSEAVSCVSAVLFAGAPQHLQVVVPGSSVGGGGGVSAVRLAL